MVAKEKSFSLYRIRGKIIFSLLFGVAVVVAMSLFADVRKMAAVLAGFEWVYLLPILALTLLNYGLRFVKWHYYLHQVGVRRIRQSDSLGIFLSGMAMALTPGKLGELLKSYLLKQVAGTPISASAPIVFAERLTDGLAMLVLASVGLVMYQHGWQLLAFVFLLSLVLLAIVHHPGAASAVTRIGRRIPLASKYVEHSGAFFQSSNRLLGLRNLLLAVGLGLVSWAGECLAFFLVLVALGFPPTWLLLVQASFILAAATLIGSISMLPGGLGVADMSVTAMLLLLLQAPPITRDTAVAATLLIRFCTLWFGVSLGFVALLLNRQLLGLTATPGTEQQAEELSP